MTKLPQAPFHRILKKAGADRVSDAAAKALTEIMEEEAEELAKKIVQVARHAGRKTIKARDVKLIINSDNEKQ